MNRNILLAGDEREDDAHLFNKKQKTRSNPLTLLYSCTTEPTAMRIEALYIDSQRRLYRPRIALTEEANNEKTRIENSERIIYFDVYIQPKISENKLHKLLEKQSRDEKEEAIRHGEMLEAKSRPPEPGEKIRFFVRRNLPTSDHETVREFTGEVTDVYWGSITILQQDGQEEIRPNSNCGLVRVVVNETFERSLVVNDPQTIRRNRYSLPL